VRPMRVAVTLPPLAGSIWVSTKMGPYCMRARMHGVMETCEIGCVRVCGPHTDAAGSRRSTGQASMSAGTVAGHEPAVLRRHPSCPSFCPFCPSCPGAPARQAGGREGGGGRKRAGHRPRRSVQQRAGPPPATAAVIERGAHARPPSTSPHTHLLRHFLAVAREISGSRALSPPQLPRSSPRFACGSRGCAPSRS